MDSSVSLFKGLRELGFPSNLCRLCLVDALGHGGLEGIDAAWGIRVLLGAALGEPRQVGLGLHTRVSSSCAELVASPREC